MTNIVNIEPISLRKYASIRLIGKTGFSNLQALSLESMLELIEKSKEEKYADARERLKKMLVCINASNLKITKIDCESNIVSITSEYTNPEDLDSLLELLKDSSECLAVEGLKFYLTEKIYVPIEIDMEDFEQFGSVLAKILSDNKGWRTKRFYIDVIPKDIANVHLDDVQKELDYLVLTISANERGLIEEYQMSILYNLKSREARLTD